jgi:hypothetical protein
MSDAFEADRSRSHVLAAVAFSVCALVLLSNVPVFAGLVHGYAWFEFGSWDFSDSLLVGEHDGDLRIIDVVDPPIGLQYACENGALARTVPGGFDDVLEAPEDLSTYQPDGPVFFGIVYVMRTGEGHYVKYRLIAEHPAPLIEYVYQPNGTRFFLEPLQVRRSTWGAVKAAYRNLGGPALP